MGWGFELAIAAQFMTIGLFGGRVHPHLPMDPDYGPGYYSPPPIPEEKPNPMYPLATAIERGGRVRLEFLNDRLQVYSTSQIVLDGEEGKRIGSSLSERGQGFIYRSMRSLQEGSYSNARPRYFLYAIYASAEDRLKPEKLLGFEVQMKLPLGVEIPLGLKEERRFFEASGKEISEVPFSCEQMIAKHS